MCQLYVDQALQKVKELYPSVLVYHYMDDVLLCHKQEEQLEKALVSLFKCFQQFDLNIAPEKIQKTSIKDYLGTRLDDTKVKPLKVTL